MHKVNEFAKIRKRLKALGSKRRAAELKKAHRGRIKAYGVSPSDIKKTASVFAKFYIRNKDIDGAYLLADELVKARTYEEPAVGIEIMAKFIRQIDMRAFWTLERWVDYMNTDDNTQLLCSKLLGPILRSHEHDLKYIYHWADSTNRWRRVAAACVMIELVRSKQDIDEAFDMAKRLCGERVVDILDSFKKLLELLTKADKKRMKIFMNDHSYHIQDYIVEDIEKRLKRRR
ncbi:DNA alkylation repair protein [Candidatus Margulisiibacteriota bacterium]